MTGTEFPVDSHLGGFCTVVISVVCHRRCHNEAIRCLLSVVQGETSTYKVTCQAGSGYSC